MTKKKKVVILGGGLAGLSLACELVEEDFDVTVLEKKAHLGGRASNTYDRKMQEPVPIGPHIFLTSYNNLRRFFRKIGSEHAISWQKKIFLEVMRGGVHYSFKHTRLPHPFYMLPWIWGFPFMSFADKMSHWRFSFRLIFSSEASLEKLDSVTAYEYLRKLGVSKRSIEIYWRFITLSILNVPIEMCSAAEFFLLFKAWSRFGNRKIGFARYGLGDVYVDRAEDYITRRGGSVVRNVQASSIRFSDTGPTRIALSHSGTTRIIDADIVVSTLTPPDLLELLPSELHEIPYFRQLRGFKPVPYISVNLWFDDKVTHKQFWALVDGPGRGRYMNTDFYDQSNIYAERSDRSFITSNIIDSQAFAHLSDAEIVERTLREIREVFPRSQANVIHSHVHRIPYVIYAAFPGMRSQKPSHRSPMRGFYVTGDWTSRKVQCMETAVRSAYECANVIFEDEKVGQKQRILDFT